MAKAATGLQLTVNDLNIVCAESINTDDMQKNRKSSAMLTFHTAIFTNLEDHPIVKTQLREAESANRIRILMTWSRQGCSTCCRD